MKDGIDPRFTKKDKERDICAQNPSKQTIKHVLGSFGILLYFFLYAWAR